MFYQTQQSTQPFHATTLLSNILAMNTKPLALVVSDDNEFHILIMHCVKEHFLWSILNVALWLRGELLCPCAVKWGVAASSSPALLLASVALGRAQPPLKNRLIVWLLVDLGAQTYIFYVKTILWLSKTKHFLFQWLGPFCLNIRVRGYPCCCYCIA